MVNHFNGIFLRDNFQDTGIVPSKGKVIYMSPDIIPVKSKSTNPKQDFNNWNKQYHTKMELGQENYVYIRCQNLTDEERTGIVNLYWTPSNLFLHPSIWSQNQLKTTEGHNSILFEHMGPHEKAIGETPFILTPPKDRHVCLIAMIMDEENYRDIPSDESIGNITKWIRNHANVGLHNYYVEDRQPDKSYTYVTEITNPESKTIIFQISTHLQNCQLGTLIKNTITGLDRGPVNHETETTRSNRSLDYSIPLPKGTYLLTVHIDAPGDATLPAGLKINIEASAPNYPSIGQDDPSIGQVHLLLEPKT